MKESALSVRHARSALEQAVYHLQISTFMNVKGSDDIRAVLSSTFRRKLCVLNTDYRE